MVVKAILVVQLNMGYKNNYKYSIGISAINYTML